LVTDDGGVVTAVEADRGPSVVDVGGRDWAKGKRPAVLYFGPLEPVPNIPGSVPLFIPTEQQGVVAILDPEMLRNRWLAVSATALTAYFRPVLGWLHAYCPVGASAGRSCCTGSTTRPTTTRADRIDRPRRAVARSATASPAYESRGAGTPNLAPV
jgi:hypothetical protein